MDATTVQELANQLHIGIDEVIQYVPAYAQSEATACLIWIILFTSLIVILGFLALLFFFKEKKWYNIRNANDHYYNDLDKRKLYWKADHMIYLYSHGKRITFIFFCVALVIGIFAIPITIENFILWTNAPEIKMLKSMMP